MPEPRYHVKIRSDFERARKFPTAYLSVYPSNPTPSERAELETMLKAYRYNTKPVSVIRLSAQWLIGHPDPISVMPFSSDLFIYLNAL